MIAQRSFQLVNVAMGALAVVASVATNARGEASSSDTRLVWSRGPEASSCAEAAEIEADAVRRLGFNPFSPNATSSLECHVTRENGVWTATIEELDERGDRAGFRVVTSPAESCTSLGAAVGLAIALIVRNRVATAPPLPLPPPREECPRCAAPPAPPDDDTWSVAWSASALGAVRVLPEPALGASLGGRVAVARVVSIAADFSFLPPVETNDTLGDYSFSASWGAVGACYDVMFGADVSMAGCVSAALGAMQVTVLDPTPVTPGAHPFAGAVAGLRFTWKLAQPAELLSGLDIFLPFARSAFLVDDAGVTKTVFEQPAVGAFFKLGVGFGR